MASNRKPAVETLNPQFTLETLAGGTTVQPTAQRQSEYDALYQEALSAETHALDALATFLEEAHKEAHDRAVDVEVRFLVERRGMDEKAARRQVSGPRADRRPSPKTADVSKFWYVSDHRKALAQGMRRCATAATVRTVTREEIEAVGAADHHILRSGYTGMLSLLDKVSLVEGYFTTDERGTNRPHRGLAALSQVRNHAVVTATDNGFLMHLNDEDYHLTGIGLANLIWKQRLGADGSLTAQTAAFSIDCVFASPWKTTIREDGITLVVPAETTFRTSDRKEHRLEADTRLSMPQALYQWCFESLLVAAQPGKRSAKAGQERYETLSQVIKTAFGGDAKHVPANRFEVEQARMLHSFLRYSDEQREEATNPTGWMGRRGITCYEALIDASLFQEEYARAEAEAASTQAARAAQRRAEREAQASVIPPFAPSADGGVSEATEAEPMLSDYPDDL